MKNTISIVFSTIVRIGVTFLLLCTSVHALANDWQQKADSVIARLPKLKGVERLDALTYICDVAYALNDPQLEQLWLEELRLAADDLEDYRRSGYAALSLLISFYNHGMSDKIEKHFDKLQAYQLEHDNLSFYYSGWNVKVLSLIDANAYYKALAELNKMQQDAISRNNALGKGIAGCALARLYNEEWNDSKKALEVYDAALACLAEQSYVSGTEWITYYDYCSLLLKEKRYKEARTVAGNWLNRIVKTIERRGNAPDTNATDEYYAYYYAFMTLLAIQDNHKNEINNAFLAFQKYQRSSNRNDYIFYDTYETYYRYVGLWDSALLYNNKRLEWAKTEKLTHKLLPAMAERARILYAQNEFYPAAKVFKEYVDMRDSLDALQNRLILKQFAEEHNLHQLDATQKQSRIYLIASLVILFILLAILLQFILYARRLRRKNKLLYSSIEQSLPQPLSDSMLMENCIIADTRNDRNDTRVEMHWQTLYNALEYLMREKLLFTISALTPKDLVQMLATSQKTLQQVIRKNTNLKDLKEYIYQFRLQYAAQLLSDNQIAIADIASKAGFRSRLSFNYLFRKNFRTTPKRYRDESLRSDK